MTKACHHFRGKASVYGLRSPWSAGSTALGPVAGRSTAWRQGTVRSLSIGCQEAERQHTLHSPASSPSLPPVAYPAVDSCFNPLMKLQSSGSSNSRNTSNTTAGRKPSLKQLSLCGPLCRPPFSSWATELTATRTKCTREKDGSSLDKTGFQPWAQMLPFSILLCLLSHGLHKGWSLRHSYGKTLGYDTFWFYRFYTLELRKFLALLQMRTPKNLHSIASVLKKFIFNACFYEYIFWILVEAASINKYTQYEASSVSLLMHIHSSMAAVSRGIRVSVVLCLWICCTICKLQMCSHPLGSLCLGKDVGVSWP